MAKARKLVLTDWTQANNALMQYFEGNKSKLATHLDMSRTTVTNFFSKKPVSESQFRNLCLALHLNWDKVSAIHSSPFTNNSSAYPSITSQPDEALIKRVREHCRQKISSQHSRIRLLSGEEIGVNQLYVDVWLLNRLPRTFQVSPDKFLKSFDLRNDRLGLGDRIQRNPGFNVANEKLKLLIFGKPGSGKTTFLKHLAVDWCQERFQSDLIAVLIELRQIRDRKWDLLSTISKELELEDQKETETLLRKGLILILMDGLDEIPTSELRHHVQERIHQVEKDYPQNRFILTCRTQIIEKIPSGFTSVEVADFSLKQAENFVRNWFEASQGSKSEAKKQWDKFEDTLSERPDLKELTATPVLLSLICLILQDEGEIPSNRAWLYKKGVKLLLNRWNDKKQIQDWEVGSKIYQKLDFPQKETLLSEIAARKFENPKNDSFVLFEQEEIVDQITYQLRLSSRREGILILKTIEAQHGLIVERADELWSFSHLTFQEYFTTQWLARLSSDKLANKIASQQWQEIINQLVKSQQPADRLLCLIKQAIDQSISRETKLQDFADRLFQKSQSTETSYKPQAIRAFYYSRFLDHDLDRITDYVLELNSIFDYFQYQSRNSNFAEFLDYKRIRDFYRSIDCAIDCAFARNLDLDFARDLDNALKFVQTRSRTRGRNITHARTRRVRNYDFEHALKHDQPSNLQRLRIALPLANNWKIFFEWWQTNGQKWTEQLHQVIIEQRSIGRSWKFTDRQMKQLESYYDANKFLVDLMNIEGAVSEDVRIEIEDTLLLPWSELQRRHPETYGHSQQPFTPPTHPGQSPPS